MKLRAEPYTLELRHDNKVTEKELRYNLNLDWCDAVLFNVVAIENKQLKEYDVILWNEKERAILFIEYKDSINAFKKLKEHETNRKKDYALNISRAFGFLKYNFIVVVKGFEADADKVKGKAQVISLAELNNFLPNSDSFESTLEELAIVNKLLGKYDRLENPIEMSRENLLNELKILRDKIEQVNK